jgi:hypothetical protein
MNEAKKNNNQEGSAKFNKSDCTKLSAKSLKCLSDNDGSQDLCAQFFKDYKDCRKNEHDEQVKARLNSGNMWG